MERKEQRYQIALTQVPHIGTVQARLLVEHFGSAQEVFKASRRQLEEVNGIGSKRASSIATFNNFDAADQEMDFLQSFKRIQPLFFTDKAYPQRLLNCFDPPPMLYYMGNANLNAPRIISIIGTRKPSAYGREMTEALIAQLAPYNVLVVSGLAYGIDAIAHTASLKEGRSTVGVLGHGLKEIYPSSHRSLAAQMEQQGGLLTEFCHQAKPDKHNFPCRNRIVAGMADATIVIETGLKGGSMITADLADGYHRDVFAFPGKATDATSAGCLRLIKQNKAIMITCAEDVTSELGWELPVHILKDASRNGNSYSGVEKTIMQELQVDDVLNLDELCMRTGASSSAISAAALNLELEHCIEICAGNRYRLTGRLQPSFAAI